MTIFGCIVPKTGFNLMAKLLAGEQLEILDVMVGTGRLDTDLQDPIQLTDLLNPLAQATTTSPVAIDNVCSFIVEYRNSMNGGLTRKEWLNEYGVFARDPELGRVLLLYGSLGDSPQPVEAYVGGNEDIRRFPVSITLTTDLEVTLSYPPGAWMDAQDVGVAIERHNISTECHADIREALANKVNGINVRSDHTLYVTKTGNDTTGDGSSAKPFLTIQAAIDHIRINLFGWHRYFISVGDGTYNEKLYLAAIPVMTITSASGDKSKVIVASDGQTVYNTGCRRISLTNLTIKGANTEGIVHAMWGDYTVEGCQIVNSDPKTAYGVYVRGGKALVLNTEINNTSIAIYSYDGSSIKVNNCSGSGNDTGLKSDGAHIFTYGSVPGGTTAKSTSNGGLILP